MLEDLVRACGNGSFKNWNVKQKLITLPKATENLLINKSVLVVMIYTIIWIMRTIMEHKTF